MMYTVEKVPLPKMGKGPRGNPITMQMRQLAIGESFVVPIDDPNWTGNQVRNENIRKQGRYVTVRLPNGIRIGRVE